MRVPRRVAGTRRRHGNVLGRHWQPVRADVPAESAQILMTEDACGGHPVGVTRSDAGEKSTKVERSQSARSTHLVGVSASPLTVGEHPLLASAHIQIHDVAHVHSGICVHDVSMQKSDEERDRNHDAVGFHVVVVK
ncbi:hypothetical protein FGB62_1g528 [Gracilaria domingensis]|nr:hypothetical protein FGB62_1g528 [Gracilaria domingensis]